MRVITPITTEQFRSMDAPPDRMWELHEGEIVEMTFPAWVHRELQDRILELFKTAFPKAQWRVMIEMPFEAGNNNRSADIGVVNRKQRGRPHGHS